MTKFSALKMACIVFVVCAATAIASFAQTLTTLHSFDVFDGYYPQAPLMQGTDGNFYGTATQGGPHNVRTGTVFKITPAGRLTKLSFDYTDWGAPNAVVEGTDGNFYGTTYAGGAYYDLGTVFKITLSGTLTTLHTFVGGDGSSPSAGLVEAADGNFYGTTFYGGAYDRGTVFKITPAGRLTTLHSFDGTDGEGPIAALLEATDGNFYGITNYGGAYGWGTVFKMTPAGRLTSLHSFDVVDGYYPFGGLAEGRDGNFYGTTPAGGEHLAGTVFRITPAGRLTTLHNFCAQTYCTDGGSPMGGLVEATDGNFYGTTFGTYKYGTVFKITPAGRLTTLYSFDGGTDGANPYAGLVEATDGNLYGTTCYGGAYGHGTVFELSLGLGPFVQVQPNSGNVGATVIILGNNLARTTSVRFHGTAATFTVVSSSEITTTVPAGATSGRITVVTPHGTLNSNVGFRVTP